MKFSLKNVVVPVLAAFLISFLFIVSPPIRSGTFRHRRKEVGSVTIIRKDYGIPSIKANSTKGIYYGLGVIHAQDRLWQLFIRKAMAQGRMAEILGSKMIYWDIYMRTIGIDRIAEEAVENLDPTSREHIQLYCDGINDYVASLYFLPLEFIGTGNKFEPFTVKDSISIAKLLTFVLDAHWITQLDSSRLADLIGFNETIEYFSLDQTMHHPDDYTFSEEEVKAAGYHDANLASHVRNQSKLEQIKKKISDFYAENSIIFDLLDFSISGNMNRLFQGLLDEELSQLLELPAASNAWVFHGNLTQSGKPILANDPHLMNSIPGVFMQSEFIIENKSNVFGATYPGVPGIPIGSSSKVSWGATALPGETQEVYAEQLNPEGTRYLYEGKYYDLKIRQEIIKIKGADPVTIDVRETRHGPLLPHFKIDNVPPGYPLSIMKGNFSLAWTGRIENETSNACFIAALQDFQDFGVLLNEIMFPLSIIYATTDGDIGLHAAGRFVKRGNHERVNFVRDGTRAYDDWHAMVKPVENFRVKNPAKGYILSMNNKLGPHIKHGFAARNTFPAVRKRRAEEMVRGWLQAGEKLTIEHSKAMQLDIVDQFSAETVPSLLKIVEKECINSTMANVNCPIVVKAAALLKGWNFEARKEWVQPTVFNSWEKFFRKKLFTDINAPEEEKKYFRLRAFAIDFISRNLRAWAEGNYSTSDLNLCHNKQEYTGNQSCMYAVLKAFEECYNWLKETLGTSESHWEWGKLHTLEHQHTPFTYTPLKYFFHRSRPADGTWRTLQMMGSLASTATREDFSSYSGGNFRMIVDLAVNTVENVLDTGVSENVLSVNYADQYELHTKGKYIKFEKFADGSVKQTKNKVKTFDLIYRD